MKKVKRGNFVAIFRVKNCFHWFKKNNSEYKNAFLGNMILKKYCIWGVLFQPTCNYSRLATLATAALATSMYTIN